MTCIHPRCRILAVLFLVFGGILTLTEEYRGRYDAATSVLLTVHLAVYAACLVHVSALVCLHRVLLNKEAWGWLVLMNLVSSGFLMGFYRSLLKWEAVHMVVGTVSCVALGSKKLLPPPEERPIPLEPVLDLDQII